MLTFAQYAQKLQENGFLEPVGRAAEQVLENEKINA
jgi:hypothetical protein